MNLNYLTAQMTIGDLFSTSGTEGDIGVLMVCTAAALILGAVIAAVFGRGKDSSKGFALTLVLLPAIVQMIILLVNGNVGTGVAVMGAFGLVRFRSAPGSAKDICAIFLAMAAGLACGTQHLLIAFAFTAFVCIVSGILMAAGFGRVSKAKILKVTIPESLDYSEVFSDILEKYTDSYSLDEVKTTNMGSLFRLSYSVNIKDEKQEKAMIDELRERNGNLEISLGRALSKDTDTL